MSTLASHALILIPATIIAWLITLGFIYTYVEQKHTAAKKKLIYRRGLIAGLIASTLTIITILRFILG